MNKQFENFFFNQLQKRNEHGLLRSLKITPSNSIDLCSNDYLGLLTDSDFHFHLNHYFQQSDRFVSGSGGSRLLTGNSQLVLETEELISNRFQSESALLFTSGYQANLGLLSSISSRNDTVLYDELCHASLKEGIRSGAAKKIMFRHNDMNDLEKKINLAKGKVFIVTEAVFSMDGDFAPIQQLAEISDHYGAGVILDEAHSCGIFGEHGAGLAATNPFVARIVTFGKAFGCQGAAVLCSKTLREYLINFSRPFIYTTAPSPILLHTIQCSLNYTLQHPEKNKNLFDNIQFWNQTVHRYSSISCDENNSPIKRIITPGNKLAISLSKAMQNEGFHVMPVLSPTVPEGKERLRIVLHNFNLFSDLENFLCSFQKLL